MHELEEEETGDRKLVEQLLWVRANEELIRAVAIGTEERNTMRET